MYNQIEDPIITPLKEKKSLKKKFFIGILALLGIFILVVTIILSFFKKSITDKIVAEINKNINTELVVQDVDLTLFSGFPQISANLNLVSLKDNFDENLLEAQAMSFRFGLFSLFSQNIDIKEVVISDGALRVVIDKKGVANYDIFKANSSSNTTNQNELAISLKSATLKNIELIYEDLRFDQAVRLNVLHGNFKGNFSTDKFDLQSNSDLEVAFIDTNGERFLSGKNVKYDADITIDLKKNYYKFNEVNFQIEKNIFAVIGDIITKKNTNDYDLKFQVKKGDLSSILYLLPQKYYDKFIGINSKGKFVFKAVIKGEQSKYRQPKIQAIFKLANGELHSQQLIKPMKNVGFEGFYSNGNLRTLKSSKLKIKNIKGFFDKQYLEADFEIKDFDNPFLDFTIDGTVPLDAIYGYLESPLISEGYGEIEINNFNIEGLLKNMQSIATIHKIKTRGSFKLDDAGLRINEEDFIFDDGILVLDNNDLNIKRLKLTTGKSDFFLEGHVNNLIPVLAADSINSHKVKLDFNLVLNSDNVDIDQLLHTLDIEDKTIKTDSNEVQSNVSFLNFLNGQFIANIKEANYEKIFINDFEGKLSFENDKVWIDGDLEAMQGEMSIEGVYHVQESPYLKANISNNNIDFNDFFEQCENFGQDVLTYKNLEGDLNSEMVINAFWDKNGNFLMEDLHVLAHLIIEDGELNRFKLMEDFSTFVKVEDLRKIRFANLENWLEIKNSKIYFPHMTILSNAMNFDLSGDYSFEHDMDFNIRVSAGNIILDKFKKHDKSLKPKIDKKGFFNLYYSIVGNLMEDYDFKRSPRKVKNAFERSDRKKIGIKRKLKREFGELQIPKIKATSKHTVPVSKKDIPRKTNHGNIEFEEESDIKTPEIVPEFNEETPDLGDDKETVDEPIDDSWMLPDPEEVQLDADELSDFEKEEEEEEFLFEDDK